MSGPTRPGWGSSNPSWDACVGWSPGRARSDHGPGDSRGGWCWRGAPFIARVVRFAEEAQCISPLAQLLFPGHLLDGRFLPHHVWVRVGSHHPLIPGRLRPLRDPARGGGKRANGVPNVARKRTVRRTSRNMKEGDGAGMSTWQLTRCS